MGPLDGSGPKAEGFLRRRRAELAILVCMNAIYFFSFFQRVAVPGTIFDELQSAFAVSAAAVAGLGAVYLYIYGGMQLVAGMMSDRFGAARVLLAGGLLLSLGSLLFPLSPSIGWLYASRALVGLGASLIYLSIVKAVDVLLGQEHFAQFLGISIFLGYSGGLAGTFPFERVVSCVGWRMAMLGAGVLCLAAFLFAAALFRKAGGMARPRHGSGLSLRLVGSILGNVRSLPFLIASPISFSIYFLVQATIGKKLLVDYCGMSSAGAASFTFVMMLVTMCAAMSGGFLSHLIGDRRKPIVMGSILVTLLAAGLLLLSVRFGLGKGWFLLAYVLLAGFSMSSPVGSALMKELNPPQAVGTSVGILNALSYLAVAAVTNAAGLIMDRFRAGAIRTPTALIYPKEAYETIFLLCFGLALFSFIVSFFISESHGKSSFVPRGPFGDATGVPTSGTQPQPIRSRRPLPFSEPRRG